MDFRTEFKNSGYSIKGYALARGLQPDVFKMVVHGTYEGRRKGFAKECVRQLYKDGLLPCGHPMYQTIKEEEQAKTQNVEADNGVDSKTNMRKAGNKPTGRLKTA